MNYLNEIADLVCYLKQQHKIDDYFQKAFVANRVRGILEGRDCFDPSQNPVKLLQTDTIGNYFYVKYDDENIVILPAENVTACSNSYEAEIDCSLTIWAVNGDVQNIVSVFTHYMNNYDAGINIGTINANKESILSLELEHLPKIPKLLTLLSINFTYRILLPTYTNELCLEYLDFCESC